MAFYTPMNSRKGKLQKMPKLGESPPSMMEFEQRAAMLQLGQVKPQKKKMFNTPLGRMFQGG